MGKSLLFKLSIALFAGLFCAFALALSVRVFLELPALYKVEQASDEKEVERVRRALDQFYGALETTAATGAWDVSYEFVTLSPEDPRYAQYVEENHGWAYHDFSQTHGWKYFDTQGEEVFASYYDLATGEPVLDRDLDLNTLASGLLSATERRSDSNVLEVGLSRSNLGPIAVVVAQLLPSDIDSAPSRGKLIIWREFDDQKISDLSATTQTQLTFIDLDEHRGDADDSPYFDSLIAGQSFTPRDESNDLRWLLRDVDGQPLYLVKQQASPRIFDDAIFSLSLIGHFLAAALVLLPFALYFLRSVVFRVQSAQRVMQEIGSSGDLTLRLEGDRPDGDELDRMLHHFNELLDRVETQDKELRSSNKKLEQENEHDSLTGINNRRFFERYLQMASYTCGRMRRDLAIAMIDIDCFKAYNDNYGHQAGDEAIRKVAQTLSDNLARLTDCVARYGGEEFVVLLLDTPLDNAVDVAERLRLGVESLQMPHEFADHSDVVTVSIGIAAWSPRADDAATLIVEAADQALYMAKSAGRNRICAIPDPDQVVRTEG